eukprot:Nk52_evm57s62 gene=Nk52_evmTU57s62
MSPAVFQEEVKKKSEEFGVPADMTKLTAKELIVKKDQVEGSIKELMSALESHGVTLTEPLVDGGGFPRSDVDIHGIRILRNQIATLQNDHKEIMDNIEKALHQIHQEAKETGTIRRSSGGALSHSDAEDLVKLVIGKISEIGEGSPADRAGLKEGDLLVSFGTVNKYNFDSLQDIQRVVQNSIGRDVDIKIIRGNGGNGRSMQRMVLTPKEWSGRGVLGCRLLPFDPNSQVDMSSSSGN